MMLGGCWLMCLDFDTSLSVDRPFHNIALRLANSVRITTPASIKKFA
jgi:hypothetical protein